MTKGQIKTLFNLGTIIFLIFCGKNMREFKNISTGTNNFSDYKKPYECKKIDFYKDSRLDYTSKGKCASIKEFPNDIPLEAMNGQYSKYFPNKEFPGRISPTDRRETLDIDIEFPVHRMVSTGGYAAPGEEIELEVPDEFVQYGYSLFIGIHKDNVSQIKDAMRDTNVIESIKIIGKTTKLKNKRGGPVYIDTWMIKEGTTEGLSWSEAEKDKAFKKGSYKLKLKNVVRLPYFKLGKTTLEQWVNEIRCNPAPWAELEANHVIITVPSSVVRNINNPEPVLNYWDSGIQSINDQAGWSKTMNTHKERFVTDVNISGGYMHSGYPIMTHLDVSQFVVDQEPLDKSKPWSTTNSKLLANYVLGHFHEVAHNRQYSHPWITAELGEASTNIFVIKANCESNGFEFNQTTLFITEGTYQAFKYFNGDESMIKKDTLKKWDNKFAGIAHTSLPNLLYMHLYTHFGFDVYKKIIVFYRNVNDESWDKNGYCKAKKEVECNKNKLNSFALELSKVTEKDMRDYLNGWGFELTWADEEIKKLHLPRWNLKPILQGIELGSSKLKEEEFYDISSLKGDGIRSLNVMRGLKNDGAEIAIWNREFNHDNTMFQLKKSGSENSIFQLVGKASEKCVGLDKDDKNVVLNDCNPNSLSQQWKLEEVIVDGISFHSLYNMNKKKYLSIVSNNPEPGAKLEFAARVDKSKGSQLWIIKEKE